MRLGDTIKGGEDIPGEIERVGGFLFAFVGAKLRVRKGGRGKEGGGGGD